MLAIPNGYERLADAYLLALRTPLDSVARVRMQGILAAMREELASATGADPEYVQNLFEEAAAAHDYVLWENPASNGHAQDTQK